MCKKFVYRVAVSDYNFIGRERETNRLLNNFKGGINGIILSVSYKFNLQKNRYNESNAGVSERLRL
jgi:hypothetical protein